MQLLRPLPTVAFSIAVVVAQWSPAATIEATSFGAPAWEPVDFNMFSAAIGTEATGYAESLETVLSLLPEPKHRQHDQLGVGPGDPHDPPYDGELSAGVANLGFQRRSVFSPFEFSNGQGVYLAFMVVPRPQSATGSSPDFASGPIIQNSLFPIHSSAESRRNGVLFSPQFGFDVLALDVVDPPFAVDGHSHFPLFYNENFDFALNPQAGTAGSYEFRITLTDQTGAGWEIVAPYQVVPEPGTATLVACGFAVLVFYAHRKRKIGVR
jgi:hypothetical protein